MKRLSLKGRKIAYEVRRSRRAKYVSLAARGDGTFVLTLPPSVPERTGKRFIHEKERWVLETLTSRRYTLSASITPERAQASFARHRLRARRLALRRIAHFNRRYDLAVRHISIKDHKTQWGSCSARQNLNFNYRICLLPRHLADYVIVHELCHLKYFDHSGAFWKLVEKALPDYRKREAELRRYLLL